MIHTAGAALVVRWVVCAGDIIVKIATDIYMYIFKYTRVIQYIRRQHHCQANTFFSEWNTTQCEVWRDALFAALSHFCLQPVFEISVHAFDYDTVGGGNDLGVTSYTYRGNTPTLQTVTTTPGNKTLRYTCGLTVKIYIFNQSLLFSGSYLHTWCIVLSSHELKVQLNFSDCL